jgi:uncharacterized membrane protein HdeD (DUF308 family)
MDLPQIIKFIVAVLTMAMGVILMIRPAAMRSFTGVSADNPRGITEIRAGVGGAFIGLGSAPLLLSNEAAYHMLGITYLIIGVIRLVSIFVDRTPVPSNWISLAVEIIFGVLLLAL